MSPFQPLPDWYEQHWYFGEAAEAPSRIAAFIASLAASAFVVRHAWASKQVKLSRHSRHLYGEPPGAFPSPFLYNEIILRLG